MSAAKSPKAISPTSCSKWQANSTRPPLCCGLLPGVMRNALLQQGELRERVLRLEQLEDVEAFYLINDLRGWRDATLLS